MGYRHAPGTDGHDGEYPAHLAVQTELAEHGRDQRRGGHQGDSGGSLGGLQCGGNDKGHEQTYAQRGQGLAKIIAQRGGGQHGAESAAGTGDQQDGRRGDDAFGYPVMEILTLVIGLEQSAGQRQTNCQGEDRLAEESDNRIQGALAQRPTRKGSDGTQTDQQDGHEDGGKGAQRAGQLPIAVAHGLIAVAVHERRTVILQLDILADETVGPEHAGHGGDEGHDQADEYDQAQTGLQPEVAGGGDGPRSRRHKGMGGIQPRRQGHAHGYHRDLHAGRQGVLQRVENDITGVAEHRNGNQIADDGNGQRGEALTEQADDALGHGDGRAAALEYHTDDGTEGDYYPDATEDVAEAPRDVPSDFQQRQLVGESGQQGGAEQGQERMQFELRRRQNDKDDQGGQNQNQSHYGASCMSCRAQRCRRSAFIQAQLRLSGKFPSRRALPVA